MSKEKTLKIAEIFYSIQGEGKYTGTPSVFIRTFGCNFECRGFGLPRGMKSDAPEIFAKHIDQYKTYEELPLASTGCDSYASWHKDFKHLSPKMTISEIVDKVMNSTGMPKWTHRPPHIIMTGGEPLLGWQRTYPDLFDALYDKGFRDFTFETNGTQELHSDFKDYLLVNAIKNKKINLTFSVSAKLPCSGEKWEDAIKPDIVTSYQQYGDVFLKLVVADDQDMYDANSAVLEYKNAGFTGNTYLMPVGGTEDEYAFTAPKVARLCMDLGYLYSPRLQVELFGNKWGT